MEQYTSQTLAFQMGQQETCVEKQKSSISSPPTQLNEDEINAIESSYAAALNALPD